MEARAHGDTSASSVHEWYRAHVAGSTRRSSPLSISDSPQQNPPPPPCLFASHPRTTAPALRAVMLCVGSLAARRDPVHDCADTTDRWPSTPGPYNIGRDRGGARKQRPPSLSPSLLPCPRALSDMHAWPQAAHTRLPSPLSLRTSTSTPLPPTLTPIPTRTRTLALTLALALTLTLFPPTHSRYSSLFSS